MAAGPQRRGASCEGNVHGLLAELGRFSQLHESGLGPAVHGPDVSCPVLPWKSCSTSRRAICYIALPPRLLAAPRHGRGPCAFERYCV